MNLSGKGASSCSAAKASLNPNAAAFVPSVIRSPVLGVGSADVFSTPSSGRPILDRSESAVSNKSDEEAQQYWDNKLPDDLTPDFKVMAIDDTQVINSSVDGNHFSPVTSYAEYQPLIAKSWDRQIPSTDQVLAREIPSYNRNPRQGFYTDVSNEQLLLDNSDLRSLEFLASRFPGFSLGVLATVFSRSGSDLNLTIERLNQLEVDGTLNRALNSRASSVASLSAHDFTSLSGTDGHYGLAQIPGDDLHHNMSPYQSMQKDSPLGIRSSSFLPSALRKMASQESSMWNYGGNGPPNTSIGSSRSSQVLASSYNSGQGRGIYSDRLQNRGSAHASPLWLKTEEAVVNMSSERLEEALDHGRVRNPFLEQARHAYLLGNKALAEDLSIQAKLYNMQMKLAAHGKAQDSIIRQRNANVQGNGREQSIDLQGLHVSEAINVLKVELAIMKNAARSTGQRLLVYILVGTGQAMRGSRNPSRVAIERYIREDEGLDYSQPEPGILRVAIY